MLWAVLQASAKTGMVSEFQEESWYGQLDRRRQKISHLVTLATGLATDAPKLVGILALYGDDRGPSAKVPLSGRVWSGSEGGVVLVRPFVGAWRCVWLLGERNSEDPRAKLAIW